MFFWIANYADIAPAFVLAKQDYDVWMINNRGTRFSEGHIHLSKDMKE